LMGISLPTRCSVILPCVLTHDAQRIKPLLGHTIPCLIELRPLAPLLRANPGSLLARQQARTIQHETQQTDIPLLVVTPYTSIGVVRPVVDPAMRARMNVLKSRIVEGSTKRTRISPKDDLAVIGTPVAIRPLLHT
jgi:hypothetical protein